MKAIVKTKKAPGVEVLDRPIPEPGENDILIKTRAASLCGSDLHMVEWEVSDLNRAFMEMISVPVVLGHEFSGEVVKTGANVAHLAPGDLVTASPVWACGVCLNCRTGRSEFCLDRRQPGLYMSDGFFQEYVCLPNSANIFKVPEIPSVEAFALTEPLAVSLGAVDVVNLPLGFKAAVLGPGPIGLLTIQLLKLAGSEMLIVTGTSSDSVRLKMAEQLGADVTVNIEKEDVVEKAWTLTGGWGVGGLDLVFEAAGAPGAIQQGLNMLKPGGTLIVIGIHSRPAEIDPFGLVLGNKKIRGVIGNTIETWHRAIRLIASGRVDTETLITHRVPITDAHKGFELAASQEAIKVIFTPSG